MLDTGVWYYICASGVSLFPLFHTHPWWSDHFMLSQCLIHVYLHASQDKEDDLKVGVKSTALRFGDLTKYWISGFGAACIGSLALSGYNADLGWCLVWYLSEVVFFLLDIDSIPETGWPYYPFLVAAAAQLAWQVSTVDLSSRSDCNMKYVLLAWNIHYLLPFWCLHNVVVDIHIMCPP